MFSLFQSFPLEIQSLVIEKCPPNDQACLALTSKHFLSLTRRIIQQESPSQSNSSGPYLPSLSETEYTMEDPMCGCGLATQVALKATNGRAALPTPGAPPAQFNIFTHRRECHELSSAIFRAQNPNKNISRSRKRCAATASRANHCQCFSIPLYRRLRSWFPAELGFCRNCDRFTPRKGKGKARKCPCHKTKAPNRFGYGRRSCRHGAKAKLWTFRKGRGGFDTHLWKMWFNGAAHERLEARLRRGMTGQERSTIPQIRHSRYAERFLETSKQEMQPRYEFRDLKPKSISTRAARCIGGRDVALEEDEWRNGIDMCQDWV